MKNTKKTVVLGLSGGVDSSVAALLLKKEGYKVIGAFMKNFSSVKNPLTGECNWVEEKKMAQKIASILKIPLVTFDFEKEYKSLVIAPMFKAYSLGLTPNPDSLCNKVIKFPLFWKAAKKLGADYIAFGHYIKKIKSGNSFTLQRAKDESKDQSYFLYDITQSDLSHTLFPIGDYTKSEIRKIAKRNHLPNWNKKSTSGICFVGKINLKEFLKEKIAERPGIVLSPEGKKIGTHPGTMFFTIGERVAPKNKIEISDKYRNQAQDRLYIADKKGNTLIIAPRNHPILKKQEIKIKNIHLINSREKIPRIIKARIRHLGSLIPSTLKKTKNNYILTFSKPQEGVAEGQSVVLYKGKEVLGGGEIRFK